MASSQLHKSSEQHRAFAQDLHYMVLIGRILCHNLLPTAPPCFAKGPKISWAFFLKASALGAKLNVIYDFMKWAHAGKSRCDPAVLLRAKFTTLWG